MEDEIFENSVERMKELFKMIHLNNNYIVFNKGAYELNIETIITPIDILREVHHLSSKQWMTSEIIFEFISIMCDYRKIKLY